MNRRHIASKMVYHSQLAAEAWSNDNFADYAIESARYELALRTLNRKDIQAQALLDSMDFAS